MEQLVFHREGGLNLTERWNEHQMPTVPSDGWKNELAQEIQFTAGFRATLKATVQKTSYKDGDAEGRYYTKSSGKNEWFQLPLFALDDPESFLETFKVWVNSYAEEWSSQQGAAHEEALRLISLDRNHEVLTNVLRYDFGRFYKTGSAYLDGPNTLSIPPLPEDALTLPGKVPLPRLITAQGDIISSMVLDSLLKDLFEPNKGLAGLLLSTEPQDVHACYVALQILTEGSIWMFKDRFRHGPQNSINGPSVPQAMIETTRSLNTIVHRANSNIRRNNITYNAILEGLSAEEKDYYNQSAPEMPRGSEEWENPRYFLPSLKDLCEKVFQPRQPFSMPEAP